MNGRLAILLPLLLYLAACRTFVDYDPDRERPHAWVETGVTSSAMYTVRKGDTLYSIAWQNGHDYRTVASWNNIRAPYTIYPGQTIRLDGKVTELPDSDLKQDAPVSKKSQVIKSHAHKERKHVSSAGPIKWQWPSDGKIINRFSSRDPGKKGLDIGGKMGQSVYAAADGKVVYSGNGLRGYGNLIIIKHNDTFFSAYAHNSRLKVKEDQSVKSGQHIADMGKSEASQVMLHFEIRRNGKPDNPLKYLPKKG